MGSWVDWDICLLFLTSNVRPTSLLGADMLHLLISWLLTKSPKEDLPVLHSLLEGRRYFYVKSGHLRDKKGFLKFI